ncbi:MAG: cytochrome c oxidase assembly factor Coa1 family protein [Pyrinomonadaceae bacterium]
MTTKKTIIIVVSIVVVLGFIVVLFVGGIVGAVFYSIGNSEAANVSKGFLRSNEQLKRDIGEVKDFGSFITGNINIKNGDGTAELSLKVVGERKTVNASVELMYRSGHQWRVTAASYKGEAGQTIDLLNPYESHKRLSAKQTVSSVVGVTILGELGSFRFRTNAN